MSTDRSFVDPAVPTFMSDLDYQEHEPLYVGKDERRGQARLLQGSMETGRGDVEIRGELAELD